MRKKIWIFGTPAVLAIGFAVMSVLYLDARAQSATSNTKISEQAATIEQQTQHIAAQTQSVYHTLINDLNDMETALTKLTAAGSAAQYTRLLADVWRLAASAQGALSQLPATHASANGMQSFVTRIGDYAYSLLCSVLAGKPIGQEDRDQLETLRTQCATMSDTMYEQLMAGELPTDALTTETYYGDSEDEESITDYPSLLYDGPFSESSEAATAQGLPQETVDEATATQIAQSFLGVEPTYDGKCEGTIVTYEYSASDEQGEVSLSVTRNGGLLLYFMRQPAGANDDAPTEEESQRSHETAARFLAEQGFGEMEPSYAQYYSGCVVLNYAAIQDGVVLYADLIKVYVDRQTNEVIGMDARNYYFHHTQRTLKAPVLTEQDARDAVSDGLTIEQVKLALIPKSNESEILCYECKCVKNDVFFLIYINAETGVEEEIYEVINSEEGDLVV